MEQQKSKNLRFVHFNDVYNIQEAKDEPVGGAARFVTAVNKYRQEKPDETVVFFSGDAYSPSMLSSLYDGVQMVDPLNKIGIDVACLGNHELDYGLEELIDLTKKNNFPWIMSNVYNTLTDQNIAETYDSKIIVKNGVKIGVMGLAEEEWLGLVTQTDPNIIDYEDYIKSARRLCKYFKQQECDLIVALTHMRNPNDLKLAEHVKDIDFILGGHDHIKHLQLINEGQSLFLKSGSDFQLFSYMDLEYIGDLENKNDIKSDVENNIFVIKNKWKLKLEFVEVNSKNFEPEPEVQKHVQHYINLSEKEMQKVVGFTATDLDTRFSVIRTQETKWGNFFADVLKIDMEAECAIINTGTIRSDCIWNTGEILYDTINKMLPISDTILSMEVTGEQLHEALENGVSKYPGFDGRFPAVSGIEFTFDADKEPMKRINKEDIFVKNQPLDYSRKYSCAMKYFLSLGKDGYDVFTKCKYIIDEENGTPHLNCMKNFFFSLKRENKKIDTFKKQENDLEKLGEIPNPLDKVKSAKQEEAPFRRSKIKKTSILLCETQKRRSSASNIPINSFIRNQSVDLGKLEFSEEQKKQEKDKENNSSSETEDEDDDDIKKQQQFQKIEQIKEQENLQSGKFPQFKAHGLVHDTKVHPETNEPLIIINPQVEGRIKVLNPKHQQ